MNDQSSPSLDDVLAMHRIELPAAHVNQLNRYCQSLWEWNRKLNLTRHTDYQKFVARDLLDSMRLADLIEPAEQVLDVGTGGGVPGILLAILRPDVEMTLCESVAKKAAAVEKIVRGLDLHVPVFHARAESLLDDFRFDALVARAVGPLWKMLRWFAPHWPSIGRLLVVKGPKWLDERSEARHRGMLGNLELRKVAEYKTPGIGALNVVLRISRKAS